MGVPGLYQFIENEHPSVRTTATQNTDTFSSDMKDIDVLCLDVSYKLHKLRVEVNSSPLGYREMVREELFDYIIHITDMIKPRVGVFISMDGVASMAKIPEQRNRRFTCDLSNTPSDTELIGSCELSPGTSFINDVSRFLLKVLAVDSPDTPNVWLSTCRHPGEGERKIFSFIQYQRSKGNSFTYCIHGNDSDILLLGLVSTHLTRGIYLIRDDVPQRTNFILPRSNKVKWYVYDISRWASLIIEPMEVPQWCPQFQSQKESNRDILRDITLLFCFVGNDYLPAIPTMDIHSFQHVLDTYAEVYNESGPLTHVANKDASRLSYTFTPSFEKLLSLLSTYEKELFEDKKDPTKFVHDGPGLWGINSTIQEVTQKIQSEGDVCNWYFFMLLWFVEGCEGDTPDWRVWYPFPNAPLLGMLKENFHTGNRLSFVDRPPCKTPNEPLLAMCFITPPHNKEILPNALRDVVVFPENKGKGIVTRNGVRRDDPYTSKRTAPSFSRVKDRITQGYEMCKQNLTASEKERNEFQKTT